MSKIEIQDWGIIDYREALQRQHQLVEEVVSNRSNNTLVLCQHPSVITIGRNGMKENIVADNHELERQGVEVVEVRRGGDVTLHNIGQLVGYPIFRLEDFRCDLHWFLREIEQCVIDLLAEFGIASGRVDGKTGVWVSSNRKICALGLHCSRWVTSHGFALNVCNKLSEFDLIVPCGISDKSVTSISAELNLEQEVEEVFTLCAHIFDKKFSQPK